MPLTVVLLVLAVVLAYFMWRFSTECTRLRVRYANIVDIDIAMADAKRQLDEARRDQAAAAARASGLLETPWAPGKVRRTQSVARRAPRAPQLLWQIDAS